MNGADSSLAGSLLIAMPSLADPNFWRSVVLLGVHSREEGAFGVVVNRETDLDLAAVLEELEQTSTLESLPPVFSGGPVEPGNGFVLYERGDEDSPPAEDALLVAEDIALTGSTEALRRHVSGESRGRFYLLLGYAGWYPGQLEREIEENSWLVAPASKKLLFDLPPSERWHAALASIGVDPGTLVDTLGSAPPS